jgi:hypothetical protein
MTRERLQNASTIAERPKAAKAQVVGVGPHDKLEKDITMIVKITANDKGTPPGKLAEAEIHFDDGYLAGLKLVGFAVWERRNGVGRNVTFPARTYSVNGERRSFALLRPVTDTTAQDRVRDLILQAYQEHEENLAVAD